MSLRRVSHTATGHSLFTVYWSAVSEALATQGRTDCERRPRHVVRGPLRLGSQSEEEPGAEAGRASRRTWTEEQQCVATCVNLRVAAVTGGMRESLRREEKNPDICFTLTFLFFETPHP